MKAKLLLAACGLLVLPLIMAAPTAFAHQGEDHDSVAEARDHMTDTREEMQATVDARLDNAKKRVCENRSKNIEAIMTRSVKRAENHIKLFSTIAERVQAFYEKKGLNVANYDELVSAIDAAKVAAESAITDMKAAANFDCDSDDPKGEIEAFKEAHKTVLNELHDYRTAVKNLIVGIREPSSEEPAQ